MPKKYSTVKPSEKESLPGIMDQFFWGDEGKNKYNMTGYSAPYISFAKMQIIRLIMLVIVFANLATLLFINLKRSLLYLNVWTQALIFLAELFLFANSGYQYIIRKNPDIQNQDENGQKKEKDSMKKQSSVRDGWKYGVVFFGVSWTFCLTSTVWFAGFVALDQICQTYNDFGYKQWRFVMLILSIVISKVVMIVEIIINALIIPFKHIIVTYLFFFLYVIVAALMSLSLNQGIYGNHLSFFEHSNFNWTQINETVTKENTTWGRDRFNDCYDYFQHEFGTVSENKNITPNWLSNWTLLGVAFVTITGFHVILGFLTKWKAEKVRGKETRAESGVTMESDGEFLRGKSSVEQLLQSQKGDTSKND